MRTGLCLWNLGKLSYGQHVTSGSRLCEERLSAGRQPKPSGYPCILRLYRRKGCSPTSSALLPHLESACWHCHHQVHRIHAQPVTASTGGALQHLLQWQPRQYTCATCAVGLMCSHTSWPQFGGCQARNGGDRILYYLNGFNFCIRVTDLNIVCP